MTPIRLYALLAAVAISKAAEAEIIVVREPITTIRPGETADVFMRLEDSRTPLFGYSISVTVKRLDDAAGTVIANVEQTSFNDERNFISASGKKRDPGFSTIIATAEGGAFASTNTDDLSAVLAEPGVNDSLLKIAFDASTDAKGDFEIALGENSALSNGDGDGVGFELKTGIIRVSDTRCANQTRGDSDCDGGVTFDDIDPFICALVNNESSWRDCVGDVSCSFFCVNDINEDGDVNFDDIDGFVECLINGGCP